MTDEPRTAKKVATGDEEIPLPPPPPPDNDEPVAPPSLRPRRLPPKKQATAPPRAAPPSLRPRHQPPKKQPVVEIDDDESCDDDESPPPLPDDTRIPPPDDYLAPRLSMITDQLGVTRDNQRVFVTHYLYGGHAGERAHLMLHIVIPWQYFQHEQLNETAALANLQGDLMLLDDFKSRYNIQGDLNVSTLRKVQVYRARNSPSLTVKHHVLRYQKSLDVQQCLDMLRPPKAAQQQQAPPRPTTVQDAFTQGYNRRNTDAEKYISKCARYCSPQAIVVFFFSFAFVGIIIGGTIVVWNRMSH